MHKIKTLSIFKQEHFQILKATPKHLLKTAKIQSRFKSSNTLLKSAKEQKSSVVPGPFICLSSCTSAREPLTDRALSAFSSKPRYPRCRALSLLLYSRVGRPHLRKLRHLRSTAVVNKSKERKISAHHSPSLLSTFFKWKVKYRNDSCPHWRLNEHPQFHWNPNGERLWWSPKIVPEETNYLHKTEILRSKKVSGRGGRKERAYWINLVWGHTELTWFCQS